MSRWSVAEFSAYKSVPFWSEIWPFFIHITCFIPNLLLFNLQVLFTYADWLGYSPSRHVILTTYPRKQLSEVEQTFNEAGLTHDTVLVLEEI